MLKLSDRLWHCVTLKEEDGGKKGHVLRRNWDVAHRSAGKEKKK